MRRWTRDDVIALAGERSDWLQRVLDAERAGYARGYAAGHDAGTRDTLDAAAADQQRACDHMRPQLSAPSFQRLQIRRYAPPGWRGKIPPGLTSQQERLWLARLPRRSDYKGGRVQSW
jgi:hypothetical protein